VGVCDDVGAVVVLAAVVEVAGVVVEDVVPPEQALRAKTAIRATIKRKINNSLFIFSPFVIIFGDLAQGCKFCPRLAEINHLL
jgi:hypothetical protein